MEIIFFSKGRISPILELKACQKKKIFLIVPPSTHLTVSSLHFAVFGGCFYFWILTDCPTRLLMPRCVKGWSMFSGPGQKLCWDTRGVSGYSNWQQGVWRSHVVGEGDLPEHSRWEPTSLLGHILVLMPCVAVSKLQSLSQSFQRRAPMTLYFSKSGLLKSFREKSLGIHEEVQC